jgi:beta-phosphoglucomutase-like phosphatase (HAD superfamily)
MRCFLCVQFPRLSSPFPSRYLEVLYISSWRLRKFSCHFDTCLLMQIQLSMVQKERDEAMVACRRTASENVALRERAKQCEARIQQDRQRLSRLEGDLAFCDNIEKQQLWAAVCTAKRRLIPLQVFARLPYALPVTYSSRVNSFLS